MVAQEAVRVYIKATVFRIRVYTKLWGGVCFFVISRTER